MSFVEKRMDVQTQVVTETIFSLTARKRIFDGSGISKDTRELMRREKHRTEKHTVRH